MTGAIGGMKLPGMGGVGGAQGSQQAGRGQQQGGDDKISEILSKYPTNDIQAAAQQVQQQQQQQAQQQQQQPQQDPTGGGQDQAKKLNLMA
ncbi:MAG: hypothetical protein WC197_04925 [Candidatus Gastranaerophilaceae bacterium]|jgi:hypothetical protein